MFPQEMCSYPQWVCWKSTVTPEGRPTKLPFSPHSGRVASVADATTWSDYGTACHVASNGYGYHGIGFVLTRNDPYTIIDLDDPQGDEEIIEFQKEIAETFDSYSEISPSGRGLHIIVKGAVAGGRRRDKVELYSCDRYFTMTGMTYHDRPIQERQFLLTRLWEELGDNSDKADIVIQDQPQQHSDEEIYNQARNAENGEKFLQLWSGNWQHMYTSQSQADYALINIIGYYSRNVEQILRMFYLSALGQRAKAKRRANNYVMPMVKRSFDNMPPLIPLETLIENLQKQAAQKREVITVAPESMPTNPYAGPLFENLPEAAADYDWTVPPGLLGELSKFIYSAAPRPVKEIALAGAIGLMAGICGRSFNVSGTGLNQYVLVLAKTGTGKEAAASGIDKIMQAVKVIAPAAMDYLGPSEIASGQALIKYLNKTPCFVSIIGEFGLLLQQICSGNANLAQAGLRRTLLQLYAKSGATDIFHPTIYADKEKNTAAIKSPSLSILGESTPETFYASLDEAMISQGLMPRITCIEYNGERPALNENHINVQPSQQLIEQICTLASNAQQLAHNSRHVDVELDPEAEQIMSAFNQKCDVSINQSDAEVSRQLWNRAHIKALKLAALIAIGVNPFNPTITREHALWAKSLVERDILNVLEKFKSGKAGRDTNELNQINEVIYVIKEYFRRPAETLKSYAVEPQMHADKVITLSYLQRRLMMKNSFKNDRLGATAAMKRTLEALVAEGAIREIRQLDMFNRYGKTMRAFVIADLTRFM